MPSAASSGHTVHDRQHIRDGTCAPPAAAAAAPVLNKDTSLKAASPRWDKSGPGNDHCAGLTA